MIACFWFKDVPIRAERKRQPELHGEPYVIASADGAIQATSSEAAAFGARPGQSATSARALCRGLIVLPYDRSEYDQAAEPLWDALAVESSIVEPVSPEVCFIEITDNDCLVRIRTLATSISTASFMQVFVGIGRTKLIARHAAFKLHLDSDPISYVSAETERESLSEVKLSSCHTFKPQQLKEFSRLGIDNFGDLQNIPKPEIQRKFKRLSYKLSRLVSGQDDDPVRPLWPPPKIEYSYSFEDETSISEQIYAALKVCTEKVAEDLKAASKYCRSLALTIQLDDRSYVREIESLIQPLDDENFLVRAAIRLLKRLALDRPVLEVSLKATDLDSGSGVQLVLLDDNDSARNYPHERRRNLEASLRYLRRKHGYSIVIPASLLFHARRVGYWTHYLAKLKNERVSVTTNSKGEPIHYKRLPRRGQNIAYTVTQIVDRWQESTWQWGRVQETQAYRVVTQPDGTSELCRISQEEWRLRAVSD